MIEGEQATGSESPPATEVVADGEVVFRLPDPEHVYSRVRLDAGLGTAGPRPELVWEDGIWSVQVALPPLHRVEYGFEVTRTIADPGEPREIESGFGPRSVLELPAYQPPAWLARSAEPGTTAELTTAVDGVTASLWSPAGLPNDVPAPLLLVHDGPDYADRGGLTQYLAVLAEEGAPARALLLSAEPRDVLYAAEEDYADAVVGEILPAARAQVATTAVIAVGASLGALAALQLEWQHPGTLAGLLLQSGSFFTPETDLQERGFPRWDAVTAFVDAVHAEPRAAELPPVAITCGTHEENAANNLLLALRLREVGVEVTHHEIADLHNFTSWRDSIDPALRELLRAVPRS